MKNLKVPKIIEEAAPNFVLYGAIGLVTFVAFKTFHVIKDKVKIPYDKD